LYLLNNDPVIAGYVPTYTGDKKSQKWESRPDNCTLKVHSMEKRYGKLFIKVQQLACVPAKPYSDEQVANKRIGTNPGGIISA
jgi:hypothetical protein